MPRFCGGRRVRGTYYCSHHEPDRPQDPQRADMSGNLFDRVIEHRELQREVRQELDAMMQERTANQYADDILARTNRKMETLLGRVRAVETDVEYQQRRQQMLQEAAARVNARRGVQGAIDPFADSSDED